ncbi:uncharacterized protein LOC112049035 [Bicyclus anynana]|uniref:Uncharacterized protein LOC112049035 n=1 Tax=Bicyclus anynana TaxID=110368 RepID=A0ABM3LXV4_BICAN|nr:uncharacterized protein LOC112049035 [Bicyclus anynana]
MKNLILLVGFVLISFAVAEEYTDRYDNINIDEILHNKRLLASYMKCVLGQGRCTPEGKEITVHLKDGMQTGCKKCTQAQKEKARKVANHLKNHEPKFWEDLKHKFDPENSNKATYEAFLASKEYKFSPNRVLMIWQTLALCLLGAVVSSEKYSDKYDKLNVTEVLHNRRLLLGYANCIFERGKCNPDMKFLKDNLEEMFETGCEKCTDAQKRISTEVSNHLIEFERDIWNELMTKYDPEGIWRKKYVERIKQMGINLPTD